MSEAPNAQELDAGTLRRSCRAEDLGFASTQEVPPLEGTVGQARAHAAIAFGLDAETVGYNIFVTGQAGTGKRTSVEAHLHDHARRRPAASDLVYVHNFRDPRRPIEIELPSGTARALAADMRTFLEDARRDLAAAFESDGDSPRRREVVEPIEREQEAALSELQEEGRARGIVLELSPTGLMTVPLRDGHPITPSELGQLSEAERAGYQRRLEELGPRIQAFMTRIRAIQRQGRERLRDLDREVGLFAVGHLIDELRERHSSTPKFAEWLSAVAGDPSRPARGRWPLSRGNAARARRRAPRSVGKARRSR